MYDKIFIAVRQLAQLYAAPFSTIDVGSLPKENGLAMYLGPGTYNARHLDRGGLRDITIALNGKHANQETVLAAMSKIHLRLSQLTSYPTGDGWQIGSISTSSSPQFIEREDSNTRQWLYGSTLRVDIYMQGACENEN